MISVRGLEKVYPRHRGLLEVLRRPGRRLPGITALNGIDFEVEAGEVHGLLGPNGAGKTTLQKILVNLVLPTRGSVRVAGFDLETGAHEIRRRVGFVPSDERSFFWRLSGLQNLRFFATLYEIPPRVAESRIRKYLEMFDLVGRADEPFAIQSSGRKKLLTVIRGLLPEPPVLVLDEATNSLDPVAGKLVMSHVGRLAKEEGRAVVWATHRLEEVGELCDRVTLIDRGETRFIGNVGEFSSGAPGGDGGGLNDLVGVFEEFVNR